MMLSNDKSENAFKIKSAEEIYAELSESRRYYEEGEFQDFDAALDELSEKYKLDE